MPNSESVPGAGSEMLRADNLTKVFHSGTEDVVVFEDVNFQVREGEFVTLDGSEIREWAGALSMPAKNQSLAEATVAVEKATTAHYHRTSEELYLVVEGLGRLVVDDEERDIAEGDCALIAPGSVHKLFNIGSRPLRVICACSPAYSRCYCFPTTKTHQLAPENSI